MVGTIEGGKKAAAKNKANNPNFYREIGRKGGRNGHTGGFATNPRLAKLAGSIGGMKGCRGWKIIKENDKYIWYESTPANKSYTSKMYMKRNFLTGTLIYISKTLDTD